MNPDHDLDRAVKTLFHRLFEVEPDSVTDQTRRGELERWDSLGHLDLLEAVRNEFGVDVQPEQALQMETFLDVKRTITELKAGDPAA
jgi:acyl carrier protein